MPVVYTTDDLCPANLEHFRWWDKAKELDPNLRVVAFTIANYGGANTGKSPEFRDWYLARRHWVEIGVHGWDHDRDRLQEGWREDQEAYISAAKEQLADFEPEGGFLYRAPGFRVLPKTEEILRRLGFRGIGHQGFIKTFSDGAILDTYDTHCTREGFTHEIHQVWNKLPRGKNS